MKNTKHHHVFRRSAALSAAAAVLWTVSVTAKPSQLPHLPPSSALTEALLQFELEQPSAAADTADGWAQLLAAEVLLPQETQDAPENGADTACVPAVPPLRRREHSTPVQETPAKAEKPKASKPKPEPKAADTAPKTFDLSGVKASQLEVENHTAGISVNPGKALKKSLNLTLKPAEEGPQILIMHTHATEAYKMDGKDVYKESDPARTTDPKYNMIRVGEEMKAVFEDMGLSVVHDTTTYDYPGYNGSYGRSLKGVQKYLDKYPTIQVVLDVHRDALIDAKGVSYAKTTTIDKEKTAQIMLVCGTNDAGLTHPNWKEHFNLAVRLQASMLAQDKTLPRPIDLRAQRFNQHLAPGSMLVEVGTSGNTLKEALAGARRFARSAGQVYLECVEQ